MKNMVTPSCWEQDFAYWESYIRCPDDFENDPIWGRFTLGQWQLAGLRYFHFAGHDISPCTNCATARKYGVICYLYEI